MLVQLAALLTAALGILSGPALPSYVSPEMSQFKDRPTLTAPSVFLIDTLERRILEAKQADVVRPIASITKLATALAILNRNPRWASRVQFKAQDSRAGDITRLVSGEEITLEDAWKLMLVGSSNDAAALLVRVVFGSEAQAVLAMNEQVQSLGLRNLHFVDATGLDPNNVGTAREVAAIARVALSYPKIRDTLLQSSFRFAPQGKAKREVHSTNQLLRWFRPAALKILGGKTGHISESGYNFVFAVGDRSHEFIGVVLGSESNEARFSEMSKLLSWGANAIQAEQSRED